MHVPRQAVLWCKEIVLVYVVLAIDLGLIFRRQHQSVGARVMLDLAILRARVDVDYPRIDIVDHFIFICVLPRM